MQTPRYIMTILATVLLATATLPAPASAQGEKDADEALVKIASDRRRLEMKFTALQSEYQDLSARVSKARIDLALMEIDSQLADSTKDQRGFKRRYLISKKRMEILTRMLKSKEHEVDICLKDISNLTIKEKKESEEKAKSTKITPSRAYTVSLGKTGIATIRGITVRADGLHDKLAALGAQEADTIAVKSHPEAPYKSLEELLHRLRDAGYLNVLITTAR